MDEAPEQANPGRRAQPGTCIGVVAAAILAAVEGGILPPGTIARSFPKSVKSRVLGVFMSGFAGQDARLYGRRDARLYGAGPKLATPLVSVKCLKDPSDASVMKTGEYVGFISNQLLPGFGPALLSSGMG